MECFFGCIIEYYSSYIGEIILHVKWWDYSNDFLNIHGRTCLYYAVCWGILSIVLINYINPFINKLLNEIYIKVSNLIINSFVTIITLFMFIDGFVSTVAIDNFLVRVAKDYQITINGVEVEENNNLSLGKSFSNEKMMMTYPNIIVVNDKQENVYLESVLKDVKNYYYKFK